mmetsp:Transcript_14024/g.26378  ORF Transcript_14024/g.26378 Transcript_14024/m.26378 type:complete len:85 (+) Transcript_14024:82-336(+)
MKLISALFLVLAPLATVSAASVTTHEGIQVTEDGNNDKNLRGPAEGVEGERKLWYPSPSKGSKSSKSKGKGKGGKGSKSRSYSW